MKLLLTSNGLCNNAISDALLGLVGKEAKDISFVFIPTAANVEMGHKGWLIDDLVNFKKQGFKSISILDIAAVNDEIWLPQLETADIVCFGGGNTMYLARIIENMENRDLFISLLQKKVYMGISAGSMVAGEFLKPEVINFIYPKEKPQATPQYHGLGFVELSFLPHLNSPHFDRTVEKNLEPMKSSLNQTVYACDDETAIKIIDGNVEVVGKGAVWVYKSE